MKRFILLSINLIVSALLFAGPKVVKISVVPAEAAIYVNNNFVGYGYAELKNELDNLKLVRRPEVIEALKEARALGDLSENAEYDAARTEQAIVESRIKELEAMLAE